MLSNRGRMYMYVPVGLYPLLALASIREEQRLKVFGSFMNLLVGEFGAEECDLTSKSGAKVNRTVQIKIQTHNIHK